MARYQYKAYGPAGKSSPACSTPREAATSYFKTFPRSPRCDVNEGLIDGNFFTVSYSPDPQKATHRWRDVSRAAAADLPDTYREAPNTPATA